MMSPKRRRREFRPSFDGQPLEDRAVPARASAFALAVPVTNARALNSAINAIHATYAAFLKAEVRTINALAHQVAAGVIDNDEALARLNDFNAAQQERADAQLLAAARKLPFGGENLAPVLQGEFANMLSGIAFVDDIFDLATRETGWFIQDTYARSRIHTINYYQEGPLFGLFRVR